MCWSYSARYNNTSYSTHNTNQPEQLFCKGMIREEHCLQIAALVLEGDHQPNLIYSCNMQPEYQAYCIQCNQTVVICRILLWQQNLLYCRLFRETFMWHWTLEKTQSQWHDRTDNKPCCSAIKKEKKKARKNAILNYMFCI